MFPRGAAQRAALLAAAAASWLQTCTGQDFAPSDADCKGGYTLFTDTKTGYTGCYKYWNDAKSWEQAGAYCEGENGALAPSRNQAEQDFLMQLVTKHSWGATFYVAANSRSATKQWIWGYPYNRPVVFNNPPNQKSRTWDSGMIVDTIPRGATSSASHFADSVVLNGFRAAYAWKIVSGAAAHAFVCRKDACSPGYDVKDQLCVVHAAPSSSAEDLAWVAAPVIVVLLFAGLGAAAFILRPDWLPCFGDGRGNRVGSHNDNAMLNDQVRSNAILNLPAIRPNAPLELPAIRPQGPPGSTGVPRQMGMPGGLGPAGGMPGVTPKPNWGQGAQDADAVFNSIDRGGDGGISREEMRKHLAAKGNDGDTDSHTSLPAIKPNALPDSDDESAGGGSRPVTGKSMASMTSIPEDLKLPRKIPTLDVHSVGSSRADPNSRPNTGGRPLNPINDTN